MVDDDPRNYAKVFRGADGQWYVTLYAGGNHERLVHSEGYRNRVDALGMMSKFFPAFEVEVEEV